ncbi:MAG: hypothetical protein R3F11_31830 [Verrucomicrobiales bacterium]
MSAGVEYEYMVIREHDADSGVVPAFGYLRVGIRVPMRDLGRALLLVDDTMAAPSPGASTRW